MLIDMPKPETLYEALLAKDARFEGRAYVCVTSTGVFCRLTCPARKPKFENCRFFETISDCMDAGFRPCKRCHPLRAASDADPALRRLVAAMEADPARRWSEWDVAAMGYDPSTVRRAFKRQFGMTFLEMARLTRLREGFETLADGGRVIDAQLDAGFSSSSGFRDAFARLLGKAPGDFTGCEMLKADWIDTPLGGMIAISDKRALHLLEFVSRKAFASELSRLKSMVKGDVGIGRYPPTDQAEQELSDFFAGRSARFNVPLVYHGTAFETEVWRALRDIPAGETLSYGELAQKIGKPSATRAVARANGANQIALIVPCHRVIGADGSLTGYGGGLWRKQQLIELEQTYKRGN